MKDPVRKMFERGYLLLVESEGRYYTPLKLMIENMGLDWKEEKARIISNPLFAAGLKELNVYDGEESHKVLGMEAPHLFSWLMRYDPDDYEGEVKSKVTAMQQSSVDALCLLFRENAPLRQPQFEL